MAAPKLGKQVAGCNYVANDEIWKSHVHMEITASKKWPQTWGFMTQSYKELTQDLNQPKKDVEKSKVQLPEQLRMRPITPIENYIKVGKSPPYPDTTTKKWDGGLPSVTANWKFMALMLEEKVDLLGNWIGLEKELYKLS